MSGNLAAITRLHVSTTSHNQLTSIACDSDGRFCPQLPNSNKIYQVAEKLLFVKSVPLPY